jgi:hypothetical protein
MGRVVCFRCKGPLDEETGKCPVCAPAAPPAPDRDPEVVESERHFLLAAARELTEPGQPRFLGYPEQDLEWKQEHLPDMPLGWHKPAVTTGDDKGKLLRQLAAGEAWQRGAAAVRLAGFREPPVALALLQRLADRDAEVRACVLWALGRLGDGLVFTPLIEFARLEKDVLVRSQLAACMHRLLTRIPAPIPKAEEAELQEKLRLDDAILEEGRPAQFLERGKLQLRLGAFLKGVGDLIRALEGEAGLSTEALHHRSRGFFLLGRPLFALDDLLACPADEPLQPAWLLYKVALVGLAKQIVAAADSKGLHDYARLFTRRLEKLRA